MSKNSFIPFLKLLKQNEHLGTSFHTSGIHFHHVSLLLVRLAAASTTGWTPSWLILQPNLDGELAAMEMLISCKFKDKYKDKFKDKYINKFKDKYKGK